METATHIPTGRKPVIYLGPSLSLEEAQKILDADYCPPIKRGDIGTLLSDPPKIIGIIDGLFFQSLAISPKEILQALRKGITVLGASSMGALRAVELSPYGMKGIGKIFHMYKSGHVDADDEVALMHDDDWHPLSEPMVNIRFTLQGALDCNILSREEKNYLVRIAKSLYFPQRTYTRLLSIALQNHKLSEEKINDLNDYIRNKTKNIKRDDAILLLKEVKNINLFCT